MSSLFKKKNGAPTPPPRSNITNGNGAVSNNNHSTFDRNNGSINNNKKGKGQVDSITAGGDDSEKMSEPYTKGGSSAVVSKPKLVFHCQQAQGSPTGLISGFSNVKELYQKIANCYDFTVDDILFCTLNTHRVDMECLLSAQLCLDDFIFVHRKGTKKEVEVTKTQEALGLTITDNGTGYAFIKRIKDGSIIDTIKVIQVGDHIEKIDDTSLVGWRHVDVAKYLKAIPVGTTFTIRLIEPLRAGFSNIGPKSDGKKGKGKSYGSGKATLRFKSNGPVIEEAPDDYTQAAIDSINKLLESFMGINDTDLSSQIWEMASAKTNTMDLAEAIDNSELESFGFTDDFIIEVWGIVTDAKSGRLTSRQSSVQSEEDDEEDLSYLINSTPSGRKNRVKS